MNPASSREELNYLVRALSHDMSANLMLLECSFGQLKESIGAGSHDGTRVAHVEACLRESRRFLDDLVQLATTGNVDMEPGRIEVADVVNEVLFEQNEFLKHRGVEVSMQQPLPVFWCNAGRLKQVVANMLRNAALHGCDPRHPRITIAPHALPQKQKHIAGVLMAGLKIHDNGQGISRQARREIFLPGRRLPAAHAEGSGMGLAIVKKIVDYYGGEVYVDPAGRAGTGFVVSLPAGDHGRREPLARAEAGPGAQLLSQGHHWKVETGGHPKQHGHSPPAIPPCGDAKK